MKHSLYFLVFTLLGLAPVNAQYYITDYQIGANPGGVNSEGENPAASLTGWTTLWEDDLTATPSFTGITSIPFTFKFNNAVVTKFIASNSGSITFDTNTTSPPPFGAIALPNSSIPNNSINILGLKPMTQVSGSTTYKSSIITKTLGQEPKRQFWIQYNFFSEPNISSGWTYWAVVLEETTNHIYLVDMKTLCRTPIGTLCANNVKISAGIQIDSTVAFSVPASPELGAYNSVVNKFDASDNKYYEFIYGSRPANDLHNINLSLPRHWGLTKPPLAITGTIRNVGASPVTSFKITYQIDSDTPFTTGAFNTTIDTNNYQQYSHPIPWTPTKQGDIIVKVWISEVNGSPDQANSNDTLSQMVTVFEDFTERKPLYEFFTSSTSTSSKSSNEVMHGVLKERNGKYCMISYPFFAPGSGDPYFTPECFNRGVYYNKALPGTGYYALPDYLIDGRWRAVVNNYSTIGFDSAQARPAFMEIKPTLTITGKKVDVSATVKSLINYPAGKYKLRMAIVEKLTTQNIKINAETSFYCVLKKMLPDDQGTSISLPAKGQTLTFNESFTFQGDYRLPIAARTSSSSVPTGTGYAGVNLEIEHSVEQFADLAVVVFVQDDSTREVLQSAWTAQDFHLGIWNVGSESTADFTIYPNPAASFIRIKLDAKQATVRVFDMNGKVMIKESITNTDYAVNCDSLNNGMYFVEVTTDNGKIAIQKLIIHK